MPIDPAIIPPERPQKDYKEQLLKAILLALGEIDIDVETLVVEATPTLYSGEASKSFTLANPAAQTGNLTLAKGVNILFLKVYGSAQVGTAYTRYELEIHDKPTYDKTSLRAAFGVPPGGAMTEDVNGIILLLTTEPMTFTFKNRESPQTTKLYYSLKCIGGDATSGETLNLIIEGTPYAMPPSP